ncbi:hypothetical protein BJY01DRAFT_169418 [Aspergillus pseudoustus]|uniref:DUF6536 domain-containing protein n=1 Tax=Aspergillus pseudoustus TaxID=1810923 RepID=A0ABR4I893_9EURO
MFHRRGRNPGNEQGIEEKPRFLSSLTSWHTFSTKFEPPSASGKAEPTDPNHARAWIKGVVICSWVMGSVLAVNIILTIIAAGLAYGANDAHNFSFASMYKGKCSTAKNWSTGMHLVINILSTLMLGASNYCMQCLASPSRSAVDEAHSKRIWVRIGVPNIWNLLRRQRGRRQLLGWVLLITSAPIHLIYNSAFYVSLSPIRYQVLVGDGGRLSENATSDFKDCMLNNADMGFGAYNGALDNGEFDILSKQECVDTFAQDFAARHRLVVLVTNTSMPESEPLAWFDRGNSQSFESKSGSKFRWLCNGNYNCDKELAEDAIENLSVQPYRWSTQRILLRIPTDDGFYDAPGYFYREQHGIPDMPDYRHLQDLLEEHPTMDRLQAELDNPSGWENSSFPGNVTILGHEARCINVPMERDLLPDTYPVDHCMALRTEETCQLFFSPPICLVVLGCNLIKLLCTLFTARDSRKDLFLTIGDAIASFLTRPDRSTEGACLLSKPLVDKRAHGWERKRNKKRTISKNSVHDSFFPLKLPLPQRWFQAVSPGRWLCTMLLFACLLAPAGCLLWLAITDFSGSYGSKTIWTNGIGQTTANTILSGLDASPNTHGIFTMVLLANTPQLLISFAYFMYNALLTTMLSAVEYTSYSVSRKPLRVSWPHPGSAQRSTYYLSLPYRYSLPLLAVSAVLHWLVSQSFFFVDILPFTATGEPYTDGELVTCGYNPVAIIFGIVVGGAMPLGATLLGLRRFRSRMPLAAQCSATISAACHPGSSSAAADDVVEREHALKPVMWGEVPGVYSSSSPLVFENRVGDSQERLNWSGSGSEDRREMLPSSSCLDTTQMESGYYHCSFSAGDVYEPSPSRRYA